MHDDNCAHEIQLIRFFYSYKEITYHYYSFIFQVLNIRISIYLLMFNEDFEVSQVLAIDGGVVMFQIPKNLVKYRLHCMNHNSKLLHFFHKNMKKMVRDKVRAFRPCTFYVYHIYRFGKSFWPPRSGVTILVFH